MVNYGMLGQEETQLTKRLLQIAENSEGYMMMNGVLGQEETQLLCGISDITLSTGKVEKPPH